MLGKCIYWKKKKTRPKPQLTGKLNCQPTFTHFGTDYNQLYNQTL